MKNMTRVLRRALGSMIVHMLIVLLLCSAAGAATAAGILPHGWINPTSFLICLIASMGTVSIMIRNGNSIMGFLLHIILIILLYGILHMIIIRAEPYRNIWIALSIALGSMIPILLRGRKRSVKY